MERLVPVTYTKIKEGWKCVFHYPDNVPMSTGVGKTKGQAYQNALEDYTEVFCGGNEVAKAENSILQKRLKN